MMRLKLQIEALQLLLVMLYSGVANTSPDGPRLLREKFAKLRQDHLKIALKGAPPAVSDMAAGEYQEALDDLLKRIENSLSG